MPQDEHVAFVADKGDIGLSFNPIISSSPLMIQSSLAFCPYDHIEVNLNATNSSEYSKYTVGGGYFKKWSFMNPSSFLKLGGSAYYSWMKVGGYVNGGFFQNFEGTAYLDQYKIQTNISYYAENIELYFAAKGSIFDAKTLVLGENNTFQTIGQILERETKPILESTFRLRLKSKYVHLYAGFNNVLMGVPLDNPYYRNVSFYGGAQFQISEILRQ
jgi:hypothetical protein